MQGKMISLSILMIIVVLIGYSQPFSIVIQNQPITIHHHGQKNYVLLGWQTWKETGFGYFRVQRSIAIGSSWLDDTLWQNLARIDTLSMADSVKIYTFADSSISVARYDYRLTIAINDTPRMHDYFGRISVPSLTNVGTIAASDIPSHFRCISNYPNPFNPTTTILFQLQKDQQISLTIYDILGHKIESLVNGLFTSGIHRYRWDASKYPSGIYLCVLHSSDSVEITKLVLQK